MPNVVALTDLTVHGAPICIEPTNTKINFDGKLFACIGATRPSAYRNYTSTCTNAKYYYCSYANQDYF